MPRLVSNSKSHVINLQECQICRDPQRKLQRLEPCGHHLCASCIKKLEQHADVQRCPFCRQGFVVLHSPPSLVELLCGRLGWRLPKAEGLQRLPSSIRAELLSQLKNNRLLYGDTLAALLGGLHLETLRLSDATNMTNTDLERVAPLLGKPPKNVILSNVPQLDDQGLQALLQVSAPILEHLDIGTASENFNGCSLTRFAKCLPCLKYLELPNCHGFESAVLSDIAIGCSATLISLDVSGSRRIDNAAVSSLAACRELQQLRLCGLFKLQTPPLIRVLEACQFLRLLDVTHCGKLRGSELFQGVALHCTELRELITGALSEVDDESVISLALSDAGASLENWSLAGSEISNESLRVIRKQCPALKRLDISGCTDVSEACVMDTVIDMKRLQVCQINYCRQLPAQFHLFVAQLLSSRALGLDDSHPRKAQGGGAQASNTSPTSCSTTCSSNESSITASFSVGSASSLPLPLGGAVSASSPSSSNGTLQREMLEPRMSSADGVAPLLDMLCRSTELPDVLGITAPDVSSTSSPASAAPEQQQSNAQAASAVEADLFTEELGDEGLQMLNHQEGFHAAGASPSSSSSAGDALTGIATSSVSASASTLVESPTSKWSSARSDFRRYGSMPASLPQSPTCALPIGSPSQTNQRVNKPLLQHRPPNSLGAAGASDRSKRSPQLMSAGSLAAIPTRRSANATSEPTQNHRSTSSSSSSGALSVARPMTAGLSPKANRSFTSHSSASSALLSADTEERGLTPKSVVHNGSSNGANKDK